MNSISVIIIAKNEADNIADCIYSARLISVDIIVADSASTDDTVKNAVKVGARLLPVTWSGYGNARNTAAAIAVNDWIIALDADERITPELASSINALSLTDDKKLFGFKRANFLGSKKIVFGEWGRDKLYRLYNKKQAAWNLALVHENIEGLGLEKSIISGELLHYTMKDVQEYYAKTILYAQLSADKYLAQKKRPSFLKRFISPVYSFLQNYIFRLGFLDGKEGFIIARTSSRYIYLKYKFLKQLIDKKVAQT